MDANPDTIVAVSSPPGRSLRGLIRVSGPGALDVAAALAALRAAAPSRQLLPVRLQAPPVPALLAVYHAPHSFTGDDIAELQVPGHPALLDRLLHRACDAGARLAEAGEFTFRAFTAGKMDLTQAEGVAATIAATSEGQLRAASMLREGELGRIAGELVETLGTHLALVEAGIDFTDQEDVVPIGPDALHQAVTAMAERLQTLRARSRSWGAVEGLPRVVLVGPPSSGKSTLFNALLGRERAVISPMPGTTRDVLAEPLQLTAADGRPCEVMLVDIAGLDDPAAALDRQIQAAAHRAIAAADLILRIHDRPTPLPPGGAGGGDLHQSATPPTPTPPTTTAAPELLIHTKADAADPHPRDHPSDALPVSALTGQNLGTLRAAIADHLGGRGVTIASHMLALQPRHEAALHSALGHLHEARDLLTPQRTAHALGAVELVAAALRAALDDLAGLGGQLTPDDVIGRVFATFCVGK